MILMPFQALSWIRLPSKAGSGFIKNLIKTLMIQIMIQDPYSYQTLRWIQIPFGSLSLIKLNPDSLKVITMLNKNKLISIMD